MRPKPHWHRTTYQGASPLPVAHTILDQPPPKNADATLAPGHYSTIVKCSDPTCQQPLAPLDAWLASLDPEA